MTIYWIVGIWLALSAVWMIAQDIQIEKLRKRIEDLEND